MLTAPQIEPHWALFLDLDGTLIDIAATPDRVNVPDDLRETLARLRLRLGSAVAVVSGRTYTEIDRLLNPLRLPGAAEHGAVMRYPSGRMQKVPGIHRLPANWVKQLRQAVLGWNGVHIEEKTYSLAIHYRLAPERKKLVRQLALSLVRTAPTRFSLLSSRMAFEIRSNNVTKAHAVKALMAHPPFRGRFPVFVGDDVTDEEAIEMALQLGGMGLHVGSTFGGEAAAVRDWLQREAARVQ